MQIVSPENSKDTRMVEVSKEEKGMDVEREKRHLKGRKSIKRKRVKFLLMELFELWVSIIKILIVL